MKAILIATDFSHGATHAVNFGYKFALQIKANIVLCNAVTAPAEIPRAELAVWPMDGYQSLLQTGIADLDQLKSDLENLNVPTDSRPLLSYINEKGTIHPLVESRLST